MRDARDSRELTFEFGRPCDQLVKEITVMARLSLKLEESGYLNSKDSSALLELGFRTKNISKVRGLQTSSVKDTERFSANAYFIR